jgi:glycosyltransferase involved in cell wall biosynthesis
MKVCILAPYQVLPTIDGAARRVMEMSISLTNSGVSVVLLHAGASTVLSNGLQLCHFPALENSSLTRAFVWSRAFDAYFAFGNLALYQKLIKLLQQMKIDILQIEGPLSIGQAKLMSVLYDKLRVVYDAHNVESLATRFSSSVPWMWPFVTFLERIATKHANAIFCVSKLDQAKISHIHFLPPSKTFLVPNGVYTSRFQLNSKEQVTRRLGINPDTKIVFFHGSLGWKPNLEAAYFISESLAPQFRHDNQTVIFLIAGPYPSRRLLVNAKHEPNVKILGFVPNIEEYICAADLCIAPLTTGSGTKLKILEYFAAGKPVVATMKAVEGMNIRNGEEAWLCTDLDEEYLQTIRAVLNGRNNGKIGERARAFAQLFEWSTIAQKIRRIYESLLPN